MQRQKTSRPGNFSPYFCRRPCSNRSSTTLRTAANCSRSLLASSSLQVSHYNPLGTVLVRELPLTVVSQRKANTERSLPFIRTSWTSSDKCGTIGDITLVITSRICQIIKSASIGSEGGCSVYLPQNGNHSTTNVALQRICVQTVFVDIKIERRERDVGKVREG